MKKLYIILIMIVIFSTIVIAGRSTLGGGDRFGRGSVIVLNPIISVDDNQMNQIDISLGEDTGTNITLSCTSNISCYTSYCKCLLHYKNKLYYNFWTLRNNYDGSQKTDNQLNNDIDLYSNKMLNILYKGLI